VHCVGGICAHGVSEPWQAPPLVDQTHPRWLWQVGWSVERLPHAVIVPLHAVCQVQPPTP
jgi:hypothetical protein